MKNNKAPVVIHTSFGGCTVSKNVLKNRCVTWGIREIPQKDIDSGWIFLFESDTEEYLKDKKNWAIVAIEQVLEFAPFLVHILGYPIGFEFTVDYEDHILFASETNEIVLKF